MCGHSIPINWCQVVKTLPILPILLLPKCLCTVLFQIIIIKLLGDGTLFWIIANYFIIKLFTQLIFIYMYVCMNLSY